MTLAQLKEQADALKIGGRVLPDNLKLEAFQSMIFDDIIQLCDPLNLAIPYRDSNIIRPINEDGNYEWFLKKPRVATLDTDYIDIDSRLDMAFVYYLLAFVANDDDRVIFELRADRVCIEYACNVLRMGLSKSKEVYEEESFLTSVRFDCVGRMYYVDETFVDLVISCLLCGNPCMVSAQKKQLELYKTYLTGASMCPTDVEALRALDTAIFMYLFNNMGEFTSYSVDELAGITTLTCELEKLGRGEEVEDWVKEIDTRLALYMKG